MRGRQPIRDRDPDLRHFAPRQPDLLDPAPQGFPFEQLHGRKMNFLLAPEIVNRQDVGMRERGYRLRFAHEARQSDRILGHSLGKNLDGDDPVQPGVSRAVDFAHAARAEGGENFVRAKTSAIRERHAAKSGGDSRSFSLTTFEFIASAEPVGEVYGSLITIAVFS